MPFKFEKLLVWQKALDLSEIVSRITIGFPKEEMYVLSSQIKRTADSVSLNIAEGSKGNRMLNLPGLSLSHCDQILRWLAVFLSQKEGISFQRKILILSITDVKKFWLC